MRAGLLVGLEQPLGWKAEQRRVAPQVALGEHRCAECGEIVVLDPVDDADVQVQLLGDLLLGETLALTLARELGPGSLASRLTGGVPGHHPPCSASSSSRVSADVANSVRSRRAYSCDCVLSPSLRSMRYPSHSACGFTGPMAM